MQDCTDLSKLSSWRFKKTCAYQQNKNLDMTDSEMVVIAEENHSRFKDRGKKTGCTHNLHG